MDNWHPNRQDSVVEYALGGRRIVLPRRRLGRARHLGWIAVAFGGFGTLFMTAWMWMPITSGIDELREQDPFGWILVLFGCLGLIGMVPALGAFAAGIAILLDATRSVVSVRQGTLRTRELFGVAYWTRRAASPVRHLRVKEMNEVKGKARQAHGSWLEASEWALVAELEAGKHFVVAAGYPRRLLLNLAQSLSPLIDADILTSTASTIRAQNSDGNRRSVSSNLPKGHEDTGDQTGDGLAIPQPTDSQSTIDRREDGITIAVPAAGVWKGSHGLMSFSVLWNVLMFVFCSAMTWKAVAADNQNDRPDGIAITVMIVFVAVGVAMSVVAVNMGRRRATLATVHDKVMVGRVSLFGIHTISWSADEIDEIVVGPSGLEMNEVPVMELQIHHRDQRNKFGCLSQLDTNELRWIAAELNQTLGLRKTDGDIAIEYDERDLGGKLVAPANSRLAIERGSGRTKINVPPRGMAHFASFQVFGLIFLLIAASVVAAVAWHYSKAEKAPGLGLILFAAVWVLFMGGAGITMFTGGLVAARRRFQIVMNARELSILRTGPFGKRRLVWGREELSEAIVEDSGTKVNNRTYYQVAVLARRRAPFGLMAGRDRDELGFVAAAINDHFHLPAASSKVPSLSHS